MQKGHLVSPKTFIELFLPFVHAFIFILNFMVSEA